MASSSSTGKRNIEAIDLGSTDEDEPAPKVASSNPSSAIIKVPAGVRMLRGVEVPSGWSVHGGSLLVRTFGDVKGSVAVAAFDFDGCLADTPLGGNDPKAWKMQYPHVPQVLQALHDAGHTIVIVTNESMDRLKKPEAIRNNVLKKTGRLASFAQAANVPLLALCATAKDEYRKPGIGAWRFFSEACAGGVTVDKARSFFVGDAAGRPGDHSDSDMVFARAAGLPFQNEKEFFERLHPK